MSRVEFEGRGTATICRYIMFMEKRETIQFRVEQELKEQLFDMATRRGTAPSELLRILIEKELADEDERIKRLQEEVMATKHVLLEILKFTQRFAFVTRDPAFMDLYKDSMLTDFLDSLILETTHGDKGVDWKRYWRAVDENYHTNYSENPPHRAQHLSREFLQGVRDTVQRQLGKKTK